MESKKISVTSIVTTSIFALTFILIGVPLWWKTTEVYRYPVPHEECQELLSQSIAHLVSVKLMIADRGVQQGLFWEDLLYFSNENKDSVEPSFTFLWTMSTVADEEQALIRQSHNISDIDAAFNLYDEEARKANIYSKSCSELRILVLPQNFTQGSKFTIGTYRQGYVLNDADSKTLAQDVIFLARKISQVDRLRKVYTSPSSYSGEKIPDKDRMRYLRFSTNFDITFSLIVPEPQVLDMNWDIKNSVNAYLKPVLEQLAPISVVNVKSQVLYMTSLPMPKPVSLDNKKEEFVVHSDYLPSLINPVEARLGSDTSVHPNLNFVVYIPTGEQTPLRIYDSRGNPVQSNAFLLPQWGGFLIYNCPAPENVSLPYKVNLDTHLLMEVFLSQFYLLLGLSDTNDLNDKRTQVLPSSSIRKWEMDFLLRKNAQEHLSAAMSSLSSLSQLLQTIGNIVIRDNVGQKIYFALSSTKESLELLSAGYLEEGFSKAQSAFVAADEAFFDPSLLALLYFPEDQKYAIYIPLFLPISIPVVSSIMHLLKFWRDKKQKLKPD